jgi:hypothetical protein
MAETSLNEEPGRPPRWMMLPPIPPVHSVAYPNPPTMLYPTTCPASLMLTATLPVEPDRPPKLMTLPPLHSVA